MATRTMNVEYVTMTKIGEKGQLTVPKQFRKELGLDAGAPVAVLRLGDGLILLPEQKRFERLSQQIRAALQAADLKPEDALAILPVAREAVYQRRYGKLRARRKGVRTARSRRSG